MYEDKIKDEFLDHLEQVRGKLSRYLLSITHSREEAEDLLQDSIIAAYQNYLKIIDKEAFSAYIFQIAIRLYKRKKWRSHLFGTYNIEKAEQIIDPTAITDLAIETKILYRALNQLPFKYKDAITLFELCGFSIKEIAILQGKNENTIKTNIRRGKQKLSILLGVTNKTYENVYQLKLKDAI